MIPKMESDQIELRTRSEDLLNFRESLGASFTWSHLANTARSSRD